MGFIEGAEIESQAGKHARFERTKEQAAGIKMSRVVDETSSDYDHRPAEHQKRNHAAYVQISLTRFPSRGGRDAPGRNLFITSGQGTSNARYVT